MKLFLTTSLAAPALAGVGSSASLTGLRYELVDLDPNDGVTPYVRFTGQSQALSLLGPRCAGVCDNQTGSFTLPAFASRIDSDTQGAGTPSAAKCSTHSRAGSTSTSAAASSS
ncbi:hypothetical protein [Azohydromonas caseinilytica]|uniref:Uncharacterized protein n=1 Tax=Azohydromonas caseinilytica TaxID=2728836 RepID=A0A848FKD8_9BURK|nr:hypothetical protein [Azohydromonas caseinilytica]NML18261.1 hypothetical protein [Azohydromonas caseinilytica]